METGIRLLELLKRPQVDYACLAPVDTTRPDLDPNIFEQVEVEIKYEGYIRRQKAQIDEMRRLEGQASAKGADYKEIHGISSEAQEKLNRVRPGNIGQASRIPASAGGYFSAADLAQPERKGGKMIGNPCG